MQYIGKDVLTQGSLLHLNPGIAWERLRSRAKQGIRKAKKAGVRVVESRDLSLMAKVWYNPDTLTRTLEPEQKMFLAYLGDELIGGIILTPVSRNTLFYHYGGSNERGRSIEVNAYLFWHVVEHFQGGPYQYLDVGVSFRPELQHYFQKYCTQPYPILFHPPQIDVRPSIGLNPFSAGDMDVPEEHGPAINTLLLEYFEAEFTFLPSWIFALQAGLRALKLPAPAQIGVWASIAESSYISRLNQLLGDRFLFVARDTAVDACLVAHRWGIPCPEVDALAASNVPLIEDCRDLLYLVAGDHRPGSFGQYAIFDFARWFPMQFGAVLVGEYVPDQGVWDSFHCLDVTKRNSVREALLRYWPARDAYAARRSENWRRYRDYFALLGMESASHHAAPPFAFVLKTEEPYSAASVHERLSQFGIRTEADNTQGLIALPCHGSMGYGQVDYIFGAFRGMVNPCHAFVRKEESGAVS